jgi:hypothetical protein
MPSVSFSGSDASVCPYELETDTPPVAAAQRAILLSLCSLFAPIAGIIIMSHWTSGGPLIRQRLVPHNLDSC